MAHAIISPLTDNNFVDDRDGLFTRLENATSPGRQKIQAFAHAAEHRATSTQHLTCGCAPVNPLALRRRCDTPGV